MKTRRMADLESCDNLTSKDKIEATVIECLKEKMKVEEMTVAYVSSRAGVGKSTFYRHYKDIYDVYEQLVDDFMQRCEKLINRVFFEKNITVKQVSWIVLKNGIKKDNELFLARDAVLINHSIEQSDARVIEILYNKAYAYVIKISKRIGADEEAAIFGAEFFLNGNIIPILTNLHDNGKLNLETVMLTMDIFEKEVELWKQQKKI